LNRTDFQLLADERLVDAQTLLAAQRWSGAYYLTGYAVERAIKACIAKLTNQYDFPDKSYAQSCFTHNLETLMLLARLKVDLDGEISSNLGFAANWLTVKDWKEDSRYQTKTEPEAVDFLGAVRNNSDGVLPWIKARW
jgi:hypothetical protein